MSNDETQNGKFKITVSADGKRWKLLTDKGLKLMKLDEQLFRIRSRKEYLLYYLRRSKNE